MTAKTLLLLFLGGLLLIPASHADDAKKLTPKAAFAKADAALNAAWTAAKASLSESEFNELREDQRGWLQYRDYLARSPQFTGLTSQEELSLDSPDYLEAATGLTLERVQWLEALARNKEMDSLTGVWMDSRGGQIEIVEGVGSLSFSITCTRGPTSHGGDLAGIAKWNQRIGWFSDNPSSDDPKTVANLAFVLRNKRLEIIGANTLQYHGGRAYFDGTYVKISSLPPARKKEIVQEAAAHSKK